MKTCSACKETKKLTEFYARSASKDGRQSRCKACCQSTSPAAKVLRNNKVLAGTGMRYCGKCLLIKPQEEFNYAGTKGPCKDCTSAVGKARYPIVNQQRAARLAAGGYVVTPRTDQPGYQAMHKRINLFKGLASQHGCTAANCTKQASDWAYSNGCDQERRDGKHRYCEHPEHYKAMCRQCHLNMDWQYNKSMVNNGL